MYVKRSWIIDIFQKISDRFYGISYGFMAPIFFVSLSFHLHIQWGVVCYLFYRYHYPDCNYRKTSGLWSGCVSVYGQSLWESAIIGSGMNGRGAVEMVVAAVVIKLSDKLLNDNTITEPLLTQDQFSPDLYGCLHP